MVNLAMVQQHSETILSMSTLLVSSLRFLPATFTRAVFLLTVRSCAGVTILMVSLETEQRLNEIIRSLLTLQMPLLPLILVIIIAAAY